MLPYGAGPVGPAGATGGALWVGMTIVERGQIVVDTAIVDVCNIVDGAVQGISAPGQLVMVATVVAYTVEVVSSGAVPEPGTGPSAGKLVVM